MLVFLELLSEELKIFYEKKKKAFNIPARQAWGQYSYFAKKSNYVIFSNLFLLPELNSLKNMLPIATVSISVI